MKKIIIIIILIIIFPIETKLIQRPITAFAEELLLVSCFNVINAKNGKLKKISIFIFLKFYFIFLNIFILNFYVHFNRYHGGCVKVYSQDLGPNTEFVCVMCSESRRSELIDYPRYDVLTCAAW